MSVFTSALAQIFQSNRMSDRSLISCTTATDSVSKRNCPSSPRMRMGPLQHPSSKVYEDRGLVSLIGHMHQHIDNRYLSRKNLTVESTRHQYILHEIFWSAYNSIKTNAIYSLARPVCIDQTLSLVSSFTAVVINLAVLWVSRLE